MALQPGNPISGQGAPLSAGSEQLFSSGPVVLDAGISVLVPALTGEFLADVDRRTAYDIVVEIDSGITLTIDDIVMPDGTQGVDYTPVQLTAEGGTAPYTWTDPDGGLVAAGLSITSGGVVGGTPTASGTIDFSPLVTDANGGTASIDLTIFIQAALAVTGETLPGATDGVAYSVSVAGQATGGNPPYTWDQFGGIPAGLSISTSGVLSGTPTFSGTITFQLKVTDADGSTAVGTFVISITTTSPVITDTPLPNGTEGTAYAPPAIVATGGTAPYTFSDPDGVLATFGLSISSGGSITGTPSSSGTCAPTIKVTDNLGATGTQAFSFNIAATSALQIVTTSIPGGTTGTAYPSTTLAGSGGTPAYTWTDPDAILASVGLAISSGGVITGTPTVAGTVSPVIHLTDSVPNTVTHTFSLVIANSLNITTTTLKNGTTAVAYSATVAATGGSGAVTFSDPDGNLVAAGLAISSSGAVTGTVDLAQTVSFTATATDAHGNTDTQALTILIKSNLAITNTSFPDGTKGTAYSEALAATGGTGTGYDFTRTAGTFPPGITLSGAGSLHGTPTSAETDSFTITVTDSAGNTATLASSLKIDSTAANSTPIFGMNIGGSAPGDSGAGPSWQPAYDALHPSAPSAPFGFSSYHGAVSSFPTSVTAGSGIPADATWTLQRWNPPHASVVAGTEDANIRLFITSATNLINSGVGFACAFYHEVDAGNKNITGPEFIAMMSYLYPRLKGTQSGWTGEPRMLVGQIFTGFDAAARLPVWMCCPANGGVKLDFTGFDRYQHGGDPSAASQYTSSASGAAQGCLFAAQKLQPDVIGSVCEGWSYNDGSTQGSVKTKDTQAQWFADLWAIAVANKFALFVPFCGGVGPHSSASTAAIGWPPTGSGTLAELKTILADSGTASGAEDDGPPFTAAPDFPFPFARVELDWFDPTGTDQLSSEHWLVPMADTSAALSNLQVRGTGAMKGALMQVSVTNLDQGSDTLASLSLYASSRPQTGSDWRTNPLHGCPGYLTPAGGTGFDGCLGVISGDTVSMALDVFPGPVLEPGTNTYLLGLFAGAVDIRARATGCSSNSEVIFTLHSQQDNTGQALLLRAFSGQAGDNQTPANQVAGLIKDTVVFPRSVVTLTVQNFDPSNNALIYFHAAAQAIS